MVDTLAEVFSLVSGLVASLFLFSVLMVQNYELEFYGYMFLVFHVIWLFIALPHMLSSLYFSREITNDYRIGIASMSIMNALILSRITNVGFLQQFPHEMLIFLELIPVILVITSFIIQILRSHPVEKSNGKMII